MSLLDLSKRDTHFENILASYLDEGKITLSPLEEEMKKRWQAAFALLLNFHSREQAVKVLQQQFGGISETTAYRDINRALALYGDVTKSQKEGWRYIIFEYNQKLFQMAIKDKNLETMGKCLDRMIKLADLDKEESQFNPAKLISQNYEINIDKHVQKALLTILNKTGVIDFNNYPTEDVNFEDVSNE